MTEGSEPWSDVGFDWANATIPEALDYVRQRVHDWRAATPRNQRRLLRVTTAEINERIEIGNNFVPEAQWRNGHWAAIDVLSILYRARDRRQFVSPLEVLSAKRTTVLDARAWLAARGDQPDIFRGEREKTWAILDRLIVELADRDANQKMRPFEAALLERRFGPDKTRGHEARR